MLQPKWLEAVVFDLDGTLVDSAEDLRAACNALLTEYQRPPLSLPTIKSFIGDGVPKLVERSMLASGGWPDVEDRQALVQRFLQIYEADPSSRTRPYPGVMETLTALRAQGLRIGVCTNKPMAATTRLLADLGLTPLVDAVAGGDSYPQRKPSPEPLLGVLRDLAVTPSRAAMIGDNEHDVAAGRAAGMALVLVMAYGYSRVPVNELPADSVVDQFTNLLTRLDLIRPHSRGPDQLIFCRHGETVSNLGGWLAGSQDVVLTERGREQAAEAAELLRHKNVSAIYSSPLRRALETAEAIATVLKLPIVQVPGLAERNWGELEGGAFPADLARAKIPGGESLEAFEQRVATAIASIPSTTEQGLPLIVAHAGTARAIHAFFGLPQDDAITPNGQPMIIRR